MCDNTAGARHIGQPVNQNQRSQILIAGKLVEYDFTADGNLAQRNFIFLDRISRKLRPRIYVYFMLNAHYRSRNLLRADF